LSRESNGDDRWCSLKASVSQNKRAVGKETVGRLRFNTEGEGRWRRQFLTQERRGPGGAARIRTAHWPAAALPGVGRKEAMWSWARARLKCWVG
jgi:hypothetical protein